jgi:hypothetical protein
MRTVRNCLLPLMALPIASVPSFAQHHAATVMVGPMLSTQGSAPLTSSVAFPRNGVGGTAIGIEAGVLFTPAHDFPISFDLSVPQRFTAIQRTRYSHVFNTRNRHREVMLTGLLHVPLVTRLRVMVSGAWRAGRVEESTLRPTVNISKSFTWTP